MIFNSLKNKSIFRFKIFLDYYELIYNIFILINFQLFNKLIKFNKFIIFSILIK